MVSAAWPPGGSETLEMVSNVARCTQSPVTRNAPFFGSVSRNVTAWSLPFRSSSRRLAVLASHATNWRKMMDCGTA